MWTFTEMAEGLLRSADGDVVSKGGGAMQQQSSTFLLGTHAFSAIARRAPAAKPLAPSPLDNGECTSGVDAPCGAVSFSVGASSADDSVLVGVAAAATPLDTPLSWEEDHAYLLECSSRGAFLWSERAAAFGVKVSDRCWAPKTTAELAGFDAAPLVAGGVVADVSVSWREHDVTFRVGGGEATLPRPRAACVQGLDSVLADGQPQPQLFPMATLVSPLSTVSLS
jgi:hypothetical protein